jgi:hypothetical protein
MSPEARDHSFDELTRGLASGTLSRGKALRLMGAALVGGALASIPGIAWAKPKPAGRKCNHNHQCESGQCVDGRCLGGGPICTPSCPANCSCLPSADGTTTICTDSFGLIQFFPIEEGGCGLCVSGEVCVAGIEPGFVGCTPACPAA